MNNTGLKCDGVTLQFHMNTNPCITYTEGEWWSIVQGVSYAVSGITVLLSLLLLPSNFKTAEKDPLLNIPI